MARQYVVTLPGKGTSETSEDTTEAAAMVLDSDDNRTTEEVVAQLDTLKPGDTIFLASGTLIDVVGVLDTKAPMPTTSEEHEEHPDQVDERELRKMESQFSSPFPTDKPKP